MSTAFYCTNSTCCDTLTPTNTRRLYGIVVTAGAGLWSEVGGLGEELLVLLFLDEVSIAGVKAGITGIIRCR